MANYYAPYSILWERGINNILQYYSARTMMLKPLWPMQKELNPRKSYIDMNFQVLKKLAKRDLVRLERVETMLKRVDRCAKQLG